MTQIKYLNVILTVNAMLLAALLWSQLSEQPVLSLPAMAQSAAGGVNADDPGIPNAGTQRQKIVEAIQRLEGKVEATNRLLSGGRLKVQVANLAELQGSSARATSQSQE